MCDALHRRNLPEWKPALCAGFWAKLLRQNTPHLSTSSTRQILECRTIFTVGKLLKVGNSHAHKSDLAADHTDRKP